MEKEDNSNEYRLIQINNYVKTKKDYLKIKKAQKLSRELSQKYHKKKLDQLNFDTYSMKYEYKEEEDDEEEICRICFEEETPDNKLIRPCKCKGSHKFIHKSCLMTWIQLNRNNPEKRDYCDICKYKFRYNNGDTENSNNIVVLNINLEPYFIKQNMRMISIRYTLIFVLSLCISGLDMNSSFVTLKMLTLGLANERNNSIIKEFSIIAKNESSSLRSYMYFVYLSYVICFIQTQYIFCMKVYIKKYKYIRYQPYKALYDSKISSISRSLTMSCLQFYIFFYVSFLSNQIFTMQFFIIISLLISINYEYFISKHNKVINELLFNIRRDNNMYLLDINDNEEKTEIMEYKSEIGSDESD